MALHTLGDYGLWLYSSTFAITAGQPCKVLVDHCGDGGGKNLGARIGRRKWPQRPALRSRGGNLFQPRLARHHPRLPPHQELSQGAEPAQKLALEEARKPGQ